MNEVVQDHATAQPNGISYNEGDKAIKLIKK